MQIRIFTFYKFFKIEPEEVPNVERALTELAEKFEARGLIILGTEGVNATLCAPAPIAMSYAAELSELLGADKLDLKWSEADRYPFHDFKVRIREEIVTISRSDIVPKGEHHHLSAEEWDQAIEEGAVVIDTRNSYEYEVGHFEGAVDPKTEEFNEFPDWVKKSGLPKDKKILIYCTGGIRCEKAIYAMEEQGYNNVYQLDGGILRYLENKPNSKFQGECFVFDYRVAVDQYLAPTKQYRLCPHCGQPAKTKIECIQCGVNAVVCDHCLEKKEEYKTCSKNCAHHFRMGHKSKKIHWDAFQKYAPDQRPSSK